MARRILYVEGNTDGTVGGSYYILLDLVLGLDRARFEPIVSFTHENVVAEKLRAGGVRVLIDPPAPPFVFRWDALNLLLAPVKKFINFVNGFVRPALARRRFLREEGIALVNLNNSIIANHTWMVAARLARVPCITHEMGMPGHYGFLARVLGRRLDAIIALSQAILDDMRRFGVAFPQTTVIHSLFEPRRYRQVESPEELRRKHAIPAGAPVIGVVGNIKEWKGQATIVRATQLLRAEYPELRCLLVGGNAEADRAYLAELEALCASLGVADRVIFTGFQKNPIDYMRLMDVVVHTSTSPEPFGIVLLEAMLLAKPLISTTIGGPAEIVLDGTTGYLVDPGNPPLLAEAVAKCLRDPAHAAEMGRRGEARLWSEFTIEQKLRETVAVYDRVLAAHG